MSVEELNEKFEELKEKTERLLANQLHINFIDEDGEVLQLQTKPSEVTSLVFNRYALQQGTPFLLSRVMYEFRFNDQVIGSNHDTIGSLVVASEVNPINAILSTIIIHVTNRLPNIPSFVKDFNNGIVPNIPAYVNNYPRCFIDQQVRLDIDGGIIGTVNADSDGDNGLFEFEIEWSDGKTELYDKKEFIELLQKYYSDFDGFSLEINKYLEGLVSKYESQVEQLDTDQSLDKPNAIILRMIKIRQQIHRLLSFINSVTDKDERGLTMFNDFSDRLREVLSSINNNMKRHLSNKSIHKVKKPLYESEDIIRAKFWPNNNKNLEPSWEKGTIRLYEEHEDVDGYGPRRVYSVEFDNGESRSDVDDYQVISDKEYKFMSMGGQNKLLEEGMKLTHIFDADSSDPWAREVGWYTLEFKGVEDTFVRLSDALLAHASGSHMLVNRGRQSMQEDYQKSAIYLRIGVLQLIDRISDPIMRRIGEILLQPVEYLPEDEFPEVEQEGFLWNMARGHYTDQHTTKMRDSVYKFALLKQCKIFGYDGPVNIDQVCRFFISSEGCLDTFLRKVPIFREGYDTIIPSESNHDESFNSRHYEVFEYLRNYEPDDADYFISIKFADDKETKRFIWHIDAQFKELLTKYTTSRGLSIKSLRIKHKNKMIFLSSIGKKTPYDLGITENDILDITIMQSTPTKMSTNEQSKQQSSPKGKNNKKKKKHKKSKKKRPVQPLVIQKTEEELKVEHSKLLGKVYEEAELTFKEIRQRLNAMNLVKTKPKQRSMQPKTTEPVEVVDNPLGDDQLLGGKAGKTQFIIQVGEVSNLYKTTKPSSGGRGRRLDDIMIDLHGLTAEEAVYMLDKHLPDWIETAMKGTYPFVIPVKIVCGGGSQILAEVVENWIKQNDHVANAPKNMYS